MKQLREKERSGRSAGLAHTSTHWLQAIHAVGNYDVDPPQRPDIWFVIETWKPIPLTARAVAAVPETDTTTNREDTPA